MKKYIAIILLLLAAGLGYIGLSMGMLPPTLTAIGFLAIAIGYFTEK
jgi:hypothetical protein